MQYFPGIDSTRNDYAEYDGFYQQLCNVNGTSECSPYYNSPLLPSFTTHGLLNTEVIKQTIFGHEAIFRNQVIELHHLYDKQRELMNEWRNEFSRENTQVGLASSEYGLTDQKQSNDFCLNPSLVGHMKPFQLDVGKNVHADKGTRQVEFASRQCELLDVSGCKKYNNKVLDLQLLATEYMDDEDDRFSVEEETTHPVRNTSPFSATDDARGDQRPMGLDVSEKEPSLESASTRLILFDLNEAYNIEEATPTMSHEELLFHDLSRNTTQLVGCFSSSSGDTDKHVHVSVTNFNDVHDIDTVVKLSYDHEAGHKTRDLILCNQESNPNSFSISADFTSLKHNDCDAHSGVDHRMNISAKKRSLKSRKAQGCLGFSENNAQDTLIGVPKSHQVIPFRDKTETHSKHVLSPVQSMLDFRRNPIAVQALPCTHAPVRLRNKKSTPSLTATRSGGYKPCTEKGHLNPMVDRVKKSRKGKKRRGDLGAWNVNQESYLLEPLNPENEECSPPRGESDENLLDMRRRFYAAEVGDAEKYVAKFAAKAILFLSADDVRINRRSLGESSVVCPDNPLHWFAEVVSVEGRKESFHDFETMTLKLEDTSTEEQYCHSIIARQDEKLTSVTTVPGRAMGVRGKRSKKLKDFQGVVLPSISSLSKHEVTEDLQLIECLMEATETSKIFGSKKRNGYFRGKRQSSNAASIITGNSPCSPLDLQNKTSSKYHTSERRPMMIDWGKITRRRRGQRYPARKLTFIQVAHTLKAH